MAFRHLTLLGPKSARLSALPLLHRVDHSRLLHSTSATDSKTTEGNTTVPTAKTAATAATAATTSAAAADNPKKTSNPEKIAANPEKAGAESEIKLHAKPLEDLLGRDPATRPTAVLYQNHSKWKILALGTFAVSQGSYWALVSYDTAKNWWHGVEPVSGVFDSSSSSGMVDLDILVGFISHPGWAVFGAGFAVSLFGVVHLVSSHLIAQVSVPREKGAGYLEVVTHDYLGQLSRPKIWRAAEMAVHGKYLQESSTHSFVGILAPGFKARFLLETDMGEFAPWLRVTDNEGKFVRGSTLKNLVEEGCISVDEPQPEPGPGFQHNRPSSIVERYEKKNKRGRKRR